jgi:hypothetical protein
MRRTLYSKLIAFFALLAFTSQMMAASAMTCELDKAAEPDAFARDMMHMDHSNADMAHMHHHDADQPPAPQHNADCCKIMGHCLSGCTLVVISSSIIFAIEKFSSGVSDFYSSNISNPVISSLYRPPISA